MFLALRAQRVSHKIFHYFSGYFRNGNGYKTFDLIVLLTIHYQPAQKHEIPLESFRHNLKDYKSLPTRTVQHNCSCEAAHRASPKTAAPFWPQGLGEPHVDADMVRTLSFPGALGLFCPVLCYNQNTAIDIALLLWFSSTAPGFCPPHVNITFSANAGREGLLYVLNIANHILLSHKIKVNPPASIEEFQM